MPGLVLHALQQANAVPASTGADYSSMAVTALGTVLPAVASPVSAALQLQPGSELVAGSDACSLLLMERMLRSARSHSSCTSCAPTAAAGATA
jgi:hypothetical protein